MPDMGVTAIRRVGNPDSLKAVAQGVTDSSLCYGTHGYYYFFFAAGGAGARSGVVDTVPLSPLRSAILRIDAAAM